MRAEHLYLNGRVVEDEVIARQYRTKAAALDDIESILEAAAVGKWAFFKRVERTPDQSRDRKRTRASRRLTMLPEQRHSALGGAACDMRAYTLAAYATPCAITAYSSPPYRIPLAARFKPSVAMLGYPEWKDKRYEQGNNNEAA